MMLSTCLRRTGFALAAAVVGAVGVFAITDASQTTSTPDADSQAALRERVVESVRAAAVPLMTVQPGRDTSDLAPLKQWIGDARIVSLGEATHGTAEFFRMKHRMFQTLVEEMGFTAFAFEAMLPESLDINHYIHTGEGDPRDALTGQYFWVWDTAEVLDLIEWMRGYNADPRHTRKISFYGYDMQQPTRAAKVAVSALEKIAPAAAGPARAALADVLDPFLAADARNWSAPRKDALLRAAESLLAELQKRKDEGRSKLGNDAWDIAHRHAVVLRQFAEFAARQDQSDMKKMHEAIAVRDRSMADNVDWILQREGDASRIALWAHNFHVGGGREPVHTMGQFLKDRHGKDMFVFAFAFNEGSFQSRELPISSAGDLKAFTVAAAPRETFDSVLHAAGLKLAALKVRGVEDNVLASWLSAPQRTREFGSAYAPSAAPETYFREVRFPETYDAVLYVDKTTAAVPNSPWVSVLPPLDAPMNGSFEERCGERSAPPGWSVERKSEEFGFEVVATHGGTGGECALSIRRVKHHRFGEAARGATQRLKATQYRGRTVTLDAMILTRLEQDGVAHLWIEASGNQQLGTRILDSSVISLRPGDRAASSWQRQELTLKVPDDADTLAYGLALVGGGEARLDEVSVRAGSPGV
jgi:erythromycin esterase